MYIAIDGDDIGKHLEKLLFSNKLEEAAAFSALITSEISRLSKYFEDHGCRVKFSGGDSIIVDAPEDFLVQLSQLNKNGINWSVGIGSSPSKAALALKKAKALGRNRVEQYEVER